MWKFIKRHPFLCLYIAALIICLILGVPFRYLLLGTLAYIVILVFVRLPDVVAVITSMQQSAQNSRNSSPKNAAEAREALDREEKFFKKYEWAYSHGATSPSPKLAYGIQLIKRYQYQKALKVFLEILTLKDPDPKVLKICRQDLAIAYEKNGDVRTAISTLEKMEEDYDILDVNFYSTLAFFYIENGQLEKARAANSKALEQKSDDPGSYDNMALIAFEEGNLEEAKVLYQQALELKNNMVSSLYMLGLIYEKQENYDKALECYRKAKGCPITGFMTVRPEQVEDAIERVSMPDE